MISTPEPHTSVCPRPGQGRATRSQAGGASRAHKLYLPRAKRVVLSDLPLEGSASQVHRKLKGMAPMPKPVNSVTDTA